MRADGAVYATTQACHTIDSCNSMSGASDGVDVASKVQQYEAFVNDVLKQDLRKAQQVKASLQAELKEFDDLEGNLVQLKEQDASQPLMVEVDLGGEVFTQAEVADTSLVYISIGLGFHVGATLDDAPRLIGIRKAGLQKKLDVALEQVAKIRAHIKMTEETLAQLQGLR